MKKEVILRLQWAGYWSVSSWAVAHGFDPRVVSVVLARWGEKEGNNVPRGKTAQILEKFKETLEKIPDKTPKKQETIEEKKPVESNWLNFKEAAEYLRVGSEKTLRNWVSRGVIPYFKEPATGCLRFNKKSLDLWLARGER